MKICAKLCENLQMSEFFSIFVLANEENGRNTQIDRQKQTNSLTETNNGTNSNDNNINPNEHEKVSDGSSWRRGDVAERL